MQHRIVDLRARRVGLINRAQELRSGRSTGGESRSELVAVEREVAILERRIATLEREGTLAARFRDIGDHAFELWVRCLGRMEGWDRELRVALAVGNTGGFIVPDGWTRDLIEAGRPFGTIENLAEPEETVGRGQVHATGVTDGLTAALIPEAGAYPADSADTFFQVDFDAYKFGTVQRMSEEWLDDNGFDPLGFLARRGGQAIAEAANPYFVAGNGNQQPRGVLNNTVGVTLGAGQTSTITSADSLIDLFHSVGPGYRANGSWVMSDDMLKIVRKLKTTDGQYIFRPGTAVGEPDSVLGKPVYPDPDMPIPGAGAKTVLFGDVRSNYIVRSAGRPKVVVLEQAYALAGQVGFRIDRHMDGDIVDTKAARLLQQAAA